MQTRKKLFYPVVCVPQDLLVNYTWALLFNMGWKHACAPSIKHFLCCTFFLWYTVMSGAEGCGWVTFRKKKAGRNYSLALCFALSASLLILMFNNCRAQAELQMSPGKIELIGHPLRHLVKVWGNMSMIPPTQLQTALSRRKTKEVEARGLYEKTAPRCVSINRALQSELNFLSWLLKTT